MKFSNEEKCREAEREVAMRRSVYERRVTAQQMNRKEAARKIAIMSEIAEDYRKLANSEGLFK